ncbi:MAG: acyl-CoA desaturase [Bacteroidetes bacterium]|nr:MAG: acyl-CoA desaturase [Bacteroidota bacterium]
MLNKTTSAKKVRFKSTKRKDEFAKQLRMEVAKYFKEKGISKYANTEMYLKTVIAALAWIGVYALIMSDTLSDKPLLFLAAFTLLGYVNIFIAFNIGHDACHNAYSANMKVNKIMSYAMNFIGANCYLFRQMHNAHHQYVNIHGIDVTLETHGLFRFTPDEPYKPIHKYQHIYTPILYSLAAVHWAVFKDFKWFFAEKHIGNNKDLKHPTSEYVALFVSKFIYFGLHLFLPLLLLSAPWWLVLLGYLSTHILPGLTFALIFQVTHVYDGTHYPMPDEEGNIENNYAIHVLETTADFSRKSKIGSWLMGGINIHVIHHIMPGVCHVHYPALTEILIRVANEHGLQYKEHKTFWEALKKHIRMLKLLSKPDTVVPRYANPAPVAAAS